MSTKIKLSRHIEKHMGSLATELYEKSGLPESENISILISKWIENVAACLSEKPCRIAEWAVQFVEACQDTGIQAADGFAAVKKLQQVLIQACSSKINGASDEELVANLTEVSARLEIAVVEHFFQRANEFNIACLRRQKAILESIAEPMAILDNQGVVESSNSALARLLRTTPEALVGTELQSLVDPAAATGLKAFLKQKRIDQSKSSFSGEIHVSDNQVPVQFHCRPFFDADNVKTGVVVFIESKKKIEGEEDAGIRFLEDRLLPLVPLCLQATDVEGNITFSSDAQSLLSIEEYEGKEALCCFLYKKKFGKMRQCPCHSLFENNQFHLEEMEFDTHAGLKYFLLIFVPIPDETGRIRRVVTCIYDLTYRKQIQKQLESHILKQQRSSLVSQLSISVAHQLRNPLSVVLGFAEMMSKGLPPEQYAEAVGRILRNSMRCKDIVENLLDFGKGLPLERQTVDLENLLRESVRSLLTPAQNRLIEWRFTGTPILVECVPEQMIQVLLSLLDNALRVAESKVVCSIEKKGEWVRLRFIDDGPGVSLDMRDKIFEPFFTTRRQEGATGLGLSLARAVTTDYGGTLTVSTPGANEPKGACFVLQLPVVKEEIAPVNEEQSEKSKLREKRILIVDDETDLQALLKTSLAMRGYKSDGAMTGMEALELLKTNDYDAIVLDYLLKGALNGRQLYEEICDQYPDLVSRVIFITADMLNYQTRLFMASTNRPVLEKPFLIADFMTELAKIIR